MSSPVVFCQGYHAQWAFGNCRGAFAIMKTEGSYWPGPWIVIVLQCTGLCSPMRNDPTLLETLLPLSALPVSLPASSLCSNMQFPLPGLPHLPNKKIRAIRIKCYYLYCVLQPVFVGIYPYAYHFFALHFFLDFRPSFWDYCISFLKYSPLEIPFLNICW